MNVHNLMEDVVTQYVDKLYNQAKKDNASWLTCDCENCRLDTVSYVLNRVPPKYVVSGRGISHSINNWEDHQLMADIEEIAVQGMRIVSSTKRPFHTSKRSDCVVQKVQEPAFNFPIISGTVLDGSNFEPLTDATITIYCNGEVAEMADKTWSNPLKTCKSTKGTYSFWIKSITAEKAQENKIFDMIIEIQAENYETLKYHFEVPVISEITASTELNATYSIKIQDLVLFRKDIL